MYSYIQHINSKQSMHMRSVIETLNSALNVVASNVIEPSSSEYCVSVRRDSLRYESVNCYALGVFGICLIDSKLLSKFVAN